ncbi:nucleotide sugar dehydrogenase [Chaetomium strumarium]|uniref:Nucleotide sugar dehydrogenase n=1 Tax=Chaetomium strumarium TaxID=1170767 RepID=A0AAJ0GS87_9PEZI|nr:nucleotide sugar dehydrogenase [Chaetomium strumarium]
MAAALFPSPSLDSGADSLEEWSGCNSPSSYNTNASSVDEDASSASSLDVGEAHRPTVAVIGVGYVGEHLVQVFSSHYPVVGYDVSPKRIEYLKKEHLSSGSDRKITFTTSESDLQNASYFLVSVPTLVQADGEVNLAHLRSAINTVSRNARAGSTVVIESSVAIGMTRELLGPLAVAQGLFVGMSPERVDPGRVSPPARSIPKVVSGLDDLVPGSLDRVVRLYSMVFERVVKVSKPEVAEMTKLYENCQRMMAIAFANEMADACVPHGIDPFEVAATAATKPFGYLPIVPSLGVGGHCIPVNPYYLFSNSEFPLLRAATEKMNQRPQEIANRLLESLGGRAVLFRAPLDLRPRVLVAGMGFKAGQSQIVNSPAVKFASALAESGKVDVMFVDPLIEQAAVPNVPRLDEKYWNKEVLESFDIVVVAIQQTGINLGVLDELRHTKVENWCKTVIVC